MSSLVNRSYTYYCEHISEPTAGMDPHTRRSTWETIQDYRRGRVIVLCSHYMDEMELLADRVAIMSKGTLQVWPETQPT